jgi:hypothetical protein
MEKALYYKTSATGQNVDEDDDDDDDESHRTTRLTIS